MKASKAPQVKLKAEETPLNPDETYGQREAKKFFDGGNDYSTDKLATVIDTAIREERSRILTSLLTEAQPMVAKYKALVKHIGGIIESTAVFAYGRGLNDAFKLIAKGAKDEKKQDLKQT